MKWSLGECITGDGKSDTKPAPQDSPASAQRTYAVRADDVDQETGAVLASRFDTALSESGHRHKVLVQLPGENDAPRVFHERLKSTAYIAEFQFPDLPEIVDGGQVWRGGHPMTGPKRDLYLTDLAHVSPALLPLSPAGTWWWTSLYTIGSTDTEPWDYDDNVDVDALLCTPDPEAGQYPRYGLKLSFACRRILVFENIVHDGYAYDSAVLRSGWKWIMRHRPKAVGGVRVPGADIRWEPFYYPAEGCSYDRYYARAGTAAPVIPDPDTFDISPGGPHTTISHETISDPTDGLDGLCVFAGFQRALRGTYAEIVQAGVPHLLIIEADVWTITKWTALDSSGWIRSKAAYPWGIYGRAISII
jgi:hypothetical protein